MANLIFNSMTYQTLGAPGLALGTTVAALVNLTILRFWFGRVLGSPARPRWWRDIALMMVANAVLGVVAFAAWKGVSHVLALLPSSAWPWGTYRLAHAVSLLATIAVAFLAYVGCLAAFRVRGAEELWALPRKFLGRIFRTAK